MAAFGDSSITKRGSLQKLPRGSRVGLSLLGGSPWQERDFVLEGDSLAYYAPGQGGFAKHLKGELRLAGCGVAACDDVLGWTVRVETRRGGKTAK